MQEFSDLLGHLRQDRRQVDRQLVEKVQPDGADVLEPLLLTGGLVDRPRGVVLDELVRPLAGRQHQPHGPGEVAGLVGVGDRLAVGGRLGKQPAVVRITRGERPVGSAKRAVRLARLTTLPTMSALTRATNSSRFRSRSSTPRGQLRGVVIAQIRRVEMLEVRRRADEGALRLRHLLPVDGEEAVDVDLRRQAETGRLQHRRPEKRVEIRDVLADEVMDFGRRAAPPVVEPLAVARRTTAAVEAR